MIFDRKWSSGFRILWCSN